MITTETITSAPSAALTERYGSSGRRPSHSRSIQPHPDRLPAAAQPLVEPVQDAQPAPQERPSGADRTQGAGGAARGTLGAGGRSSRIRHVCHVRSAARQYSSAAADEYPPGAADEADAEAPAEPEPPELFDEPGVSSA